MNNKEKAFTLIEVIVAMVIMGISFSVLARGFMQINTGIENSSDYTYVSAWATSKLNELESKIDLNNHGSFKYREKIYDWHTEEGYVNKDLRKIRLIVQWDGKNSRKKYYFSKIIFNNY